MMLKKFQHLPKYIIILLSILLLAPLKTQAGLFDSIPCFGSGDCTPCHIVQVIVIIGQFILGISGSVALLMFVYGAFLWLVSAGNKNLVGKGKTIFVNATIGLAIVLFAYVIISAVLYAVSGGAFTDWNKICS